MASDLVCSASSSSGWSSGARRRVGGVLDDVLEEVANDGCILTRECAVSVERDGQENPNSGGRTTTTVAAHRARTGR